MKYQKYPAQTIKVAGDMRRAPATFENPAFSSTEWRYLVLQHTFGKTQAWKSAHGYVQESWSGTSLYSSLHKSHLGYCSEGCRFGKLPSEK